MTQRFWSINDLYPAISVQEFVWEQEFTSPFDPTKIRLECKKEWKDHFENESDLFEI